MNNAFGIAVTVGIGAGLAYPYAALESAPYGFALLFLLMFLAGLPVERLARPRTRPLLVGLALSFVVIPLMQIVLARLFVPLETFRLGLAFAALMPVAMVAPYFCARAGVDPAPSYALMLVTTLLTPFTAPLLLLMEHELPLRMTPIALSLGLFIVVPTAARWGFRYWTSGECWLVRYSGALNAITLGALVFVIVGAVSFRINLNYVGYPTLIAVLILAFVQDFGGHFLSFWLARRFVSEGDARAIAISVGMKNVAISAGLFSFYAPQAAIPSVCGFVAHAFYFTWVANLKPAPPLVPDRAGHERSREG